MDDLRFLPRLRVLRGREIAVCPGKAELLEATARDAAPAAVSGAPPRAGRW